MYLPPADMTISNFLEVRYLRHVNRASCCGLLLLLSAANSSATPHLFGIKISVTNPTAQARSAEDIVVPIADLRKIAPDLHAGQLIVTVTDSNTEAEDAARLQATEVPSQVDDL